MSSRAKIPFQIRRTIVNQRHVNLVYPLALTAIEDKKFSLSFKPVWSRAMVGCHIRSSDIRILVVKFDHGQYEFTTDGEKPSTATMEGPGVDPEVVDKSETKLAEIFEAYPSNPAVAACRLHVQKHFGA